MLALGAGLARIFLDETGDTCRSSFITSDATKVGELKLFLILIGEFVKICILKRPSALFVFLNRFDEFVA
jgi:hypothetical protein